MPSISTVTPVLKSFTLMVPAATTTSPPRRGSGACSTKCTTATIQRARGWVGGWSGRCGGAHCCCPAPAAPWSLRAVCRQTRAGVDSAASGTHPVCLCERCWPHCCCAAGLPARCAVLCCEAAGRQRWRQHCEFRGEGARLCWRQHGCTVTESSCHTHLLPRVDCILLRVPPCDAARRLAVCQCCRCRGGGACGVGGVIAVVQLVREQSTVHNALFARPLRAWGLSRSGWHSTLPHAQSVRE